MDTVRYCGEGAFAWRGFVENRAGLAGHVGGLGWATGNVTCLYDRQSGDFLGHPPCGDRHRPVALVLSSAALFAASFPPLRLWPLAWVALAFLVVAARAVSPLGAAALGALWTMAAAIGTAWWFPGTVGRYLDVSVAAGLAAFVVVGVVLPALPVMAFTAWLSWIGRAGWRAPVVVAAGWAGVELLWTHLPLASWGLLAVSQVPALAAVQVAELVGPVGVGFVVAAVNGWIALLLEGAGGRSLALAALSVGPLLASTMAFGFVRLAEVPPRGTAALRVAAVQFAATPREATALTQRAAAAGARLAVWPEHAIESEPRPEEPLGSPLGAASRGIDLLVGAPSTAWLAAGPRLRNSVFLLRDGRLVGRSDKRWLLPVAERGYLAGTTLRSLRARGARVGALLCGEALVPGPARAAAARGAELLAVVASDRWVPTAAPSEQMLAHTVLRAIENRRWVVRATAGGVSAVIDPYGRVTSRVPFGGVGVAEGAVYPGAPITPYQRWGDGAGWCVVALGCFVAANPGFRRTAGTV